MNNEEKKEEKFFYKYTTNIFTTEIRCKESDYYYELTENRKEKEWRVDILKEEKSIFGISDMIPFISTDFTCEITEDGLNLNGTEFVIQKGSDMDLLIEAFPLLSKHREQSDAYIQFKALQQDIQKEKESMQQESKKAFDRAEKHAKELEKKRKARKERNRKRGAKSK